MRFSRLLLFASLATLAGCVSAPTPQTPAQFRALVVEHPSATMHETYRVRGSYRTVAARIRRKAAECFNRTISNQTCYSGGGCSVVRYTFHTHFRASRAGSELSVQMRSSNAVHLNGKPPKGGDFIDVTDITPTRHGGTRIATYGLSTAWLKYVPRAVKHWADDSNLGCPDFSARM